MYQTVSKRFEFSASVRPCRTDWSEAQNDLYFGPGSHARYGYGNNYTAYFVFHGPVDTRTGMLVDLAIVKERVLRLLAQRYDHKFLNVDTRPFDTVPPTAENLARQLLNDAQSLFGDLSAQPVVCHLEVSPETAATAYADGRIERDYWLEFSAARRTCSPHLTDEENIKQFGKASSPMGHGHNYRLRATFTGELKPEDGHIVPYGWSSDFLQRLRLTFDHRNLNEEVPELAGIPITTECLARFACEQLKQNLPVHRVRLYETSNFFAEYSIDGSFQLAYELPFHAAHRLHSDGLSDDDNQHLYGKCNNPAGHGHRYRVEATIGGSLDERSGTLYNLLDLHDRLHAALTPWEYKHLDLEIPDFRNQPSTGENISTALWPRLNTGVQNRLVRMRLWETPNNRFTLRPNPTLTPRTV